jgi:glycosyltransferase involved in cell wall biosynthesis
VFDVVCLSHLRWDGVYQRPQHLMSRFARASSVLFVEEPMPTDGAPRVEVSRREDGLSIAVPRIPADAGPEETVALQRDMLDAVLDDRPPAPYVLWHYTPMTIAFSDHLRPLVRVFDCMDELSAFNGAPAEMLRREAELFAAADLVFTGGHRLWESKRDRHPQVHAFPSSVDVPHFARARTATAEPADQAAIPGPRLGYFGVIDERMDLELVAGIADAHPEWQLVMVGPVVKIDEADLPRRANIHYLGSKPYGELPGYVAGWDVALMPFALNASTEFISPTKTPEYLAAGRPVVSVPIADVVRPWGRDGHVSIATGADAFCAAVARHLAATPEEVAARVAAADEALAGLSWNRTWRRMLAMIEEVAAPRLVTRRDAPAAARVPSATA